MPIRWESCHVVRYDRFHGIARLVWHLEFLREANRALPMKSWVGLEMLFNMVAVDALKRANPKRAGMERASIIWVWHLGKRGRSIEHM